MTTGIRGYLDWIESRIDSIHTIEKIGRVVQVTGLIIESEGPEASLGQIVYIVSDQNKNLTVINKDLSVPAEVVGFRGNRLLLMPLSEMRNIHVGALSIASKRASQVPVGGELIGRVIDGFGKPIDAKGPLNATYLEGLKGKNINPMKRSIIREPFQTGVKAIDTFTAMGIGQRMGIFAGSGVGKSTLLGMIAKGSSSDVNVIALVGERGRELREFIENDLGEQGMNKSVVVISTSDQSAALRLRAAHLAIRIAEYFRDNGKNVLFLMDSVTRLAMAQREIGLSIGEPPTSRGYTPSVFSILPQMLERSGMSEKGSITALYTVLVEGDEINEPISDAVRGILDGHIILSRDLATANHFPAIDVLASVSRLIRMVCSEDDLRLIGMARDIMALYRKNEDLINIGAYTRGSNQKLDDAIEKQAKLTRFLRQASEHIYSRDKSFMELRTILK